MQGGVNAVKRFASSPQDAGEGRLDNALKRLDRALDPSSTAQDRCGVMERLVAYLQAGRLIAAGPPPPPDEAEPMQTEQACRQTSHSMHTCKPCTHALRHPALLMHHSSMHATLMREQCSTYTI